MNRRLFLLRHAKSSWDDPSLADIQRPLAKRGRKAMAAMRAAIFERGFMPEVALVSTAQRTRETFDALLPWPKPPRVEYLEALYHASPETMLPLLRGFDPGVASVMLVGHNPGLMDLAIRLAGADGGVLARRVAEKFPTGALAVFDLPGAWSELGETPAQLTQFLLPRELDGGR